VADPESAPPGIDVTKPHIARVYDWALGGKDNYAADREYAAKLMEFAPEYPMLARANRAFLVRVVRFLAESGIRQFIDLGTGIPTSPNVHEVAWSVDPSARVVYVDNDPIVAVHNDALLTAQEGVVTIKADIRRPDVVFDHPDMRRLIDLDQPVGVLFLAVLHLVADDDAARIVTTFQEHVAQGSYLAISHGTSDSDPKTVAQIREMSKKGPIRGYPRSNAEIRQFFDGLEMVEPGMVSVTDWRPETESPRTRLIWMGGIGRKR
jgi:hypothetical protein